MTNNEDIERERFEAWVMSAPCAAYRGISKRDDGTYFHIQTQFCWAAWLARSNQEES